MLLDSLFNLPSQHALCFAFCKSCNAFLLGGKVMTIMVPFVFQNNWSNYTFSKFMIKVWIESLCNVEAYHNPGFGFGNILKCIFGNGKGICHIARFCIFVIVAM